MKEESEDLSQGLMDLKEIILFITATFFFGLITTSGLSDTVGKKPYL